MALHSWCGLLFSTLNITMITSLLVGYLPQSNALHPLFREKYSSFQGVLQEHTGMS